MPAEVPLRADGSSGGQGQRASSGRTLLSSAESESLSQLAYLRSDLILTYWWRTFLVLFLHLQGASHSSTLDAPGSYQPGLPGTDVTLTSSLCPALSCVRSLLLMFFHFSSTSMFEACGVQWWQTVRSSRAHWKGHHHRVILSTQNADGN